MIILMWMWFGVESCNENISVKIGVSAVYSFLLLYIIDMHLKNSIGRILNDYCIFILSALQIGCNAQLFNSNLCVKYFPHYKRGQFKLLTWQLF